MATFTKAERALMVRLARALRRSLEPFDAWPRDLRAWARRDRLDRLFADVESAEEGATEADLTRHMRLIEEIREWWRRELEFIRTYPLEPPETWVRRPLAPAAEKRVRRAWRASTPTVRRAVQSPRKRTSR